MPAVAEFLIYAQDEWPVRVGLTSWVDAGPRAGIGAKASSPMKLTMSPLRPVAAIPFAPWRLLRSRHDAQPGTHLCVEAVDGFVENLALSLLLRRSAPVV